MRKNDLHESMQRKNIVQDWKSFDVESHDESLDNQQSE